MSEYKVILNPFTGKLQRVSDISLDITSPSDGQGLLYSNESEYQASFSPLTFGGEDYNDAAFGAQSASVYYLIGGSGIGTVSEDGTVVDFPNPGNLHVALCDIDGNGTSGYVTIILITGFLTGQGQTEDLAGAQAVLRNFINGSLDVDNFKANAFTYSSNVFTWAGFTGFEVAGAVSVSTGGTTPPSIEYIEGLAKFVNQYSPLSRVYNTINDDDVPDAVETATATVLTPFWTATQDDSNSRFELTNDNNELALTNGTSIDGIASIVVKDDSGDYIPSGLIEFQRYDSDDGVWVTQHAISGASCLVFPFSWTSGTFRVRFTHTIGSTTNINSSFRLNF